ncbi:50S ribosomal protein L24e [Halorientalis litorea]|jgi:large subunit ribosomal protein L24e|uniref:50S ribosomal protein L24e n=1 Tax=Halorientalis litorea TaxID=2931977 RepID=UPI001FF64385|nr:50S ribosomal protein L24e [Halorientalis litorea]
MPRTRECDYCGDDIEPGTGTMLVRNDGSTVDYCSSKCEKNADLGREARDVEWTEEGRGPEGGAEPDEEPDADEEPDIEAEPAADEDADESGAAPDLESAEAEAEDDTEAADADGADDAEAEEDA